jgi:hypothetical protein
MNLEESKRNNLQARIKQESSSAIKKRFMFIAQVHRSSSSSSAKVVQISTANPRL